MQPPETDINQLRAAMAALEAQRTVLGDAVVDPALDSMRLQLAALDADVPTQQQRKQATILFADVAGFTTLSEMMDAEEVTDLINALWARLDSIITTYGGRIDKHIGDAIMAVWGVEAAREDDPERAVRAALAMQAEVAAYHSALLSERRLPDAPPVALEMRVGINTGPVLLGRVGLTREYTAMGDAVNLANRLEQAAPTGGVLVSHNTYRHVRGIFDTEPLGPLQMRGRHQPVPVYIVLQPRPRVFRPATRGVEGVSTRMIGRDAELAALQAAFHEVIEGGRSRVVTVIGDAGVGKSRLLYEFDNWVEARPEVVRYFKGRSIPTLQSVPYSLWRDLLALRFDILDSDSQAVALSKFRKGMGDDGRANSGAAATRAPDAADGHPANRDRIPHFTDIIGHWLGFDFSSSPAVASLSNSPDFASLAQAYFLRFSRLLAAERGVAVLLEDIHWADDSSLDLIGRMAEAIPDAHLLIVCLARPSLFERRPKWCEDLPGHRQIHLSPLDDTASRSLVDEILQRAEWIPDALCDLIVEGAEGNPFYIEELIKMLIEQGVILREPDGSRRTEQWQVVEEKLGAFRVPPTLTALLQSRLDGLPQAERQVLQRAAVVGRVFWDDAVRLLFEDGETAGGALPAHAGAPGSDSSIAAGEMPFLLSSLARRELIEHRERSAFAGTNEYSFGHNLLREVTYETVLLRDRRNYHARVARWLEVNSGARLSEYLGLIAEHYSMAGADNRAAAYLERSGDAAQRSGAYHSARAAFERALALRPDDATEAIAGLRLKLGAVHWNLGDFPAAERSLFFARDSARRSGDTRGQANALYWLSRVAISRGDYPNARMLLAYGLPLARASDPETLAQVLYGVADVAWKVGDLDTLSAYITESLALARAAGNITLELMALNRLGTMAYLTGDLEAARDYYQTCLDLARTSGNLEREATALMNLGALAHRQGDPGGGLAFYRAALAHYREIGRSEQVVMALGNLAEAEVDQGDLAAARDDVGEGVAVAWRLGLLPRLTVMLFVYGRYLDAVGERDRAAAVLRLILTHPATENQTRPQLGELLKAWGCDLSGETAELEAVVAEVLGSGTDSLTV